MSAWSAIFRFELRYQLRQPLLYLVVFALSTLLFIAGRDDGPGGASGRLHINAPGVILEQLMKGIFLVLFLMTAFVVSAAVRDFDRGTSALFFSKPISRRDYITARFAGAMAVCAIPYLIGTIALAIGSLMPGIDPSRLGPFRISPYLFALGVLILPTMLALGAAFYALATLTRSSITTYVGVVAFFAISTSAGFVASRFAHPWLAGLLDPFGTMALSSSLEHWTVAELNARTPELGGVLLWNRLLWLALGFGALGASVIAFDPSRARSPGGSQNMLGDAEPGTRASELRSVVVHRLFTRSTMLQQFLRQVRHETRSVVLSYPFLGILLLGLVVLVQGALPAGNLFGTPMHPRTYLMLEALQGGFSIVLLLAVVLYSGELVWRERALETSEIMDAMPMPSGVMYWAKVTALLGMIALFLIVGVLALMGYQLANDFRQIEPALYLRGAAIAAVYPVLMLFLSCLLHAVARNRLAGYGLVILFIVVWDLLEEFGFEHGLYRYASLPGTPYSDFNGYGPFLAPFLWFALYWGLAAVVLAGLSTLLWRRGTDAGWRRRSSEARARFHGATRIVIGVGVVAFLAVGAWIFYNTNVLNEYLPSTVALERRAAYERAYRRHERATLPKVVAVRAEVDIFPERRRVEVRGTYRLRNQSTVPLRDVHLSVPAAARLRSVRLPAHEVVLSDTVAGYAIYRLRTPLAVRDSIELGFEVVSEQRGFVNNGTSVTIVENGSSFTKRDFFPVVGYDAHRQITDPDERRERHLDPLRMASVSDTVALRSTPRAPDADRVAFDVTLSTSPDQIAVTSGELQREWTKDGRRHFQYRADVPISHHFAFTSARYEVARRASNGVNVEIHHAPTHSTNVPRMLDAAELALAQNSASFAPYPHRTLRIVEFPRYERDATSFPGMITVSESMGFNARVHRDSPIDFPFYVTAHEVAHQWWGQALLAANVEGAATLHETLAQYSALRTMAREFGEARLQAVLDFEREQYLRGRAGERGEEPPLSRVDREEYVYYHKGALAMWALRDAVGESALDAVLKRFLERAVGAEPRYPTTADLLAELRAGLPASARPVIASWFESVDTPELGRPPR